MKLVSIVKTTKSLRGENSSSLCAFHGFMDSQLQPATFEITDNKSFPCQPKEKNQPGSNKKGNNKKQAGEHTKK